MAGSQAFSPGSILAASLLISTSVIGSTYWISGRLPPPGSGTADVIVGIRCVDYEEPIMSSATPGALPTEIVGWSKRPEPFDVTINKTKGVGWFDGGVTGLSEDHPAALTTEPSTYRLETSTATANRKSSEWLVLDRTDATIGLYAQNEGLPTETLKRGGFCSEIKGKF